LEVLDLQEQEIYTALKSHFGFNAFKGLQLDIIKSIIAGKDTLVIMPTGGGKSLCYQLPALMDEGTAIIISPLIALMKNQVDLIRAFGAKNGVAHFLNSSLSKKESETVKKDVLAGTTKILYLAPESLTKEDNVEFLKKIRIPFVAVDEAHCISEWGHDFRPEYRRIREIVDNLGQIPIIALTASATPKVQDDIIKNLKMDNPAEFKSSFDRANLFYEVRPKLSKEKSVKEIITYIRRNAGKSGIIYCLSRKSVEELAESLRVNGVKALEYHAGLDGNTRAKHQDAFLMEDVDVIVATIAFGMGIDKPDVRFVIHYDVPKSLESYYQETGRAGRDGIKSECLMFYSPKDLFKLEKFLKDKPFSEREIGTQLLIEMGGFAEISMCRRKALLHYFGEEYVGTACNDSKMCDNCKHPKETIQVIDEMKLVLEVVAEIKEKFSIEHIIHILKGEKTVGVKNYHHYNLDTFGEGDEKSNLFWKSVIRQGILEGFLLKDIESYGLIILLDKGKEFIQKPYAITVILDTDYSNAEGDDDDIITNGQGGGGGMDEKLFNLLKELRKDIAKSQKLPPYIIFQDPSMEEMAIKYPIDMQELSQIVGVSASKAQRYGQPFIDLINKYVNENEIERPSDLVIKSVINRSAQKVFIIQAIDRKVDLEDIATSRGITLLEVLKEIEGIVLSGTKVNIEYHTNEILDKNDQMGMFDYFRNAHHEDLELAWEDIGKDVYSLEEVLMMRIKFISEMAN